MWQDVKRFLETHRWISPACVLTLSIIFSRWFWPDLTFPDGDTFYHVKMTELLARGVPREFPWLPFTTLAENYIDHHFLFHIILFPFVWLFGSFVGVKVATIVLTAVALTVFYLVVRALRYSAPAFWTLLLALSPSFIFRMHLAKAPAFSLIFVLLGIYFLVKKKSVALAILAFLYVWAYDGWPLLFFIALLWVFASSFLHVMMMERGASLGRAGDRAPARLWRMLVAPGHARPLAGIVVGTLLGIIVNPYFPGNLSFYWHHIVQIGVVSYASKIGVGAEWYGMGTSELLGAHAVVTALFVLAIMLILARAHAAAREGIAAHHETLARSFGLAVVAAAFFVLTLRSRRMVDYFLPTAVLATASLWTIGVPAWRAVLARATAFLRSKKNVLIAIPVIVLIISPPLLQADSLMSHRRVLADGFAPSAFARIGTWLETHVEPGSIIFHSRWDTFPMLFYQADAVRYIVGLDTTFLYLRDPERYALWNTIVRGEYVGDPATPIRDFFGASYIVLDRRKDQDAFGRQLAIYPSFVKVYEDRDGTIFMIR